MNVTSALFDSKINVGSLSLANEVNDCKIRLCLTVTINVAGLS